MQGTSREDILAKASAMGLELSADGKSWVPVKKPEQKAPPEDKKVKIRITDQPVPGWLKWTVRLSEIGVIISVILYAIATLAVIFLLASFFSMF